MAKSTDTMTKLRYSELKKNWGCTKCGWCWKYCTLFYCAVVHLVESFHSTPFCILFSFVSATVQAYFLSLIRNLSVRNNFHLSVMEIIAMELIIFLAHFVLQIACKLFRASVQTCYTYGNYFLCKLPPIPTVVILNFISN